MNTGRVHVGFALALSALTLFVLVSATIGQQQPNPDLGFTDTPILPGMKWHVHDPVRPHPIVITPGALPGAPPSDAVVLFDGKDLSKWAQRGRGADSAKEPGSARERASRRNSNLPWLFSNRS